MKDGLENIDEIFKQAFDGFETNVDPSVWTNVQNAISGGAGATDVTPKVDPTVVTTVATKSIITKIAVGVALVGTLGTAGYFLATNYNTSKFTKENEIAKTNIEPNATEIIEQVEPIVIETEQKDQKEAQEQRVFVKDDLNTEPIAEEVATIDNIEKTSSNESSVEVNETSNSILVDNNKTQVTPTETDQDEITTSNDDKKSVEEKEKEESKSTNANSVIKREPMKKEAVVNKIPNAISPNGDGLNDVVKITGENLVEIELVIMDKTGKAVYKITSLDDEWAGKNQSGFDLIPGVYYMAGIVIDADGNSKKIKQAINLFK